MSKIIIVSFKKKKRREIIIVICLQIVLYLIFLNNIVFFFFFFSNCLSKSFLSSFKPSSPSPSNCRISRQNFARKIVKVDRFNLFRFSCPYYFKILSYFCLNIIPLVEKTENLVLGLSLVIGLMHVIVPHVHKFSLLFHLLVFLLLSIRTKSFVIFSCGTSLFKAQTHFRPYYNLN